MWLNKKHEKQIKASQKNDYKKCTENKKKKNTAHMYKAYTKI